MTDWTVILTAIVGSIAIAAAAMAGWSVRSGADSRTVAAVAIAAGALATVGGYAIWRALSGQALQAPVFASAAVLFGALTVSMR